MQRSIYYIIFIFINIAHVFMMMGLFFLNFIKRRTCVIRFVSIFICVTFMFYLKTCLYWDKWCNLPLKIKIIEVIITSGFCSAVWKIQRMNQNMA